jgi:hypothetical protein
MFSKSEIHIKSGIAAKTRRWFKAAGSRRLALLGMLLLTSLGASAQRTEQFDNWTYERNREFSLASNTNSSGSVFGYACVRATNVCTFFYAPDRLNCTEGTKYTLLVNSGTSSTGRSSVCKRLDSGPLQFADVIENTEAVRDQMFKAGPILGIARGNRDGGFNTSKFEMRGFQDAFARVNRTRDSDGDRLDGDRSDSGSNLPAGSFQRSCSRIRMNGDTLIADCKDTNGAYGETSLQRAFNCKVGIENIDGILTCRQR